MSPTTLTNIDRCTIAQILSRCIIAWFGNSSVQDGKKLQLPWKSSQCNQGPLTSHSFASPPPSGKTSKVRIQIQLLSHRYQITKRSSYKLKLQSRFPNFHCGSCTFFFALHILCGCSIMVTTLFCTLVFFSLDYLLYLCLT